MPNSLIQSPSILDLLYPHCILPWISSLKITNIHIVIIQPFEHQIVNINPYSPPPIVTSIQVELIPLAQGPNPSR